MVLFPLAVQNGVLEGSNCSKWLIDRLTDLN